MSAPGVRYYCCCVCFETPFPGRDIPVFRPSVPDAPVACLDPEVFCLPTFDRFRVHASCHGTLSFSFPVYVVFRYLSWLPAGLRWTLWCCVLRIADGSKADNCMKESLCYVSMHEALGDLDAMNYCYFRHTTCFIYYNDRPNHIHVDIACSPRIEGPVS